MTPDSPNLERNVVELLDELSQLQDELFTVLAEKRQRMAAADFSPAGEGDGDESLDHRELTLCDRLQQCHDRRAALLSEAGQRGLPADSIASLAPHLAAGKPGGLAERVKDASQRMRLLQHQSITNWVVAQRSLLHVTQYRDRRPDKADIWE